MVRLKIVMRCQILFFDWASGQTARGAKKVMQGWLLQWFTRRRVQKEGIPVPTAPSQEEQQRDIDWRISHSKTGANYVWPPEAEIVTMKRELQ